MPTTKDGVSGVDSKAIGGEPITGELGILYRFHSLAAEARAQALHLSAGVDRFILREYVDQQLFAECKSLDGVEEAIGTRKADQSERVARLRLVASGKPWG